MREAVPGTASAVAEPGVFSIGQHMENNVVGPTAADVSKMCQDMNDLQVRFNKITSADFRSKSSKPWKPEVTPPRRRGGFNRGRGSRQFALSKEMTDLRTVRVTVIKIGIMIRETILEILEVEDKAEEILEAI